MYKVRVIIFLTFVLYGFSLAQVTSQEVSWPPKDLPDWWNSRGSHCKTSTCMKRSSSYSDTSADETGPFWASRGKRLPIYIYDNLNADEPRWILVRRKDGNEDATNEYDPYMLKRGKKESDSRRLRRLMHLLAARIASQDALGGRGRRADIVKDAALAADDESPFFAPRGKKNNSVSAIRPSE